MRPDADVYRNDLLVAHLFRIDNGIRLDFVPGADFLSSGLEAPGPYESPDLPHFFLNLLPEGTRLKLLLDSARSRDDALELLLRVGQDTIGDVVVIPHEMPLRPLEPLVEYRDLSQVSFWDLFAEGIGQKADGAVPGVQEKISASTIAFGVRFRNRPGAILKLNPPGFSLLVQNEAFFLKMASACGLQVAEAELVYDQKAEPGLLVTRFDRVRNGKQLEKRHQEDGCQLLDLPPSRKYDLPYRRLAKKIEATTSSPKLDLLRLIELYAFSYLIGNGDLHAKNVSLLWRDDLVVLSPAYDLPSTLPYPRTSRQMALKIGPKDDNFQVRDFVDFGSEFGIPEKVVKESVLRICDLAEPWIERLGEIGFDDRTTSKLAFEMSRRLRKLPR